MAMSSYLLLSLLRLGNGKLDKKDNEINVHLGALQLSENHPYLPYT